MPSQRKTKSNWPFVSRHPVVQAAYEESREAGESHNIALMCACRQGPGLSTDTTFTRGFASQPFDGPVNPFVHKRYAAMARKAGVSISGKRYMSGLARYPGDPKAWVSDRSDIKKLCERRGWGCEGAVKVKAREKKNGAKEKRFIKVA